MDRSSIEEVSLCESERAENKGGALTIDDLIQKDIRFRPYTIESSYLAQQEYHSEDS